VTVGIRANNSSKKNKKKSHKSFPIRSGRVEVMEAATTTSAEKLSAINKSLVQLNMALGRMAARQDRMILDLKKMTVALTPTATTTPTFVPGRVLEQQTAKTSSPSLFSANQVVGVGAVDTDAVFVSAMPTRCSTVGSAVNVDSNHVAGAFLTSGTTHLPTTTSTGAGNSTLQGMVGSGMNMPASCSTHVLTYHEMVLVHTPTTLTPACCVVLPVKLRSIQQISV
jgi:hypothetical protein